MSAASSRAAAAADKRRQILDAAIRVFATRGFHACRVSDVAGFGAAAWTGAESPSAFRRSLNRFPHFEQETPAPPAAMVSAASSLSFNRA